jgi:hypothetical protein
MSIRSILLIIIAAGAVLYAMFIVNEGGFQQKNPVSIEGRVVEIDLVNQQLALTHGEIKKPASILKCTGNDCPPSWWKASPTGDFFPVTTPALLNGLGVGHRVQFDLKYDSFGNAVIVAIQILDKNP